MSDITWTEEELTEFNRLTWELSSRANLSRIVARLDMDAFVQAHGKEKCDAMFAHLVEQEKG